MNGVATRMVKEMLALDRDAAKAARKTPAARAARLRRLNAIFDEVNCVLAVAIFTAGAMATIGFAIGIVLTIFGVL